MTSPSPDPVETTISHLIGQLDLLQKVRLLTAATYWRTHSEPAIGLRSVLVSDGPVGVRGEIFDERSTSANLPCPIAMAASWDPSMVQELGTLIGLEARRKGVDAVLAPTVNIQRSPLGGRHFEFFSEDPLLSSRMGVAYVQGVQEAGVGATAKHYVANDSETERFTVDVIVDERALREVYLAPFESMVVEAGVWLVMAAYNSVNGQTMTENALLSDPLKREWAFDGVVVSDWTAVRSTVASANAGVDLIFPGPEGPWGELLVQAVRAGEVEEATVNDKVTRLLRLAARLGALGNFSVRQLTLHRPARDPKMLLRRAAGAGMVLLRNEGSLLPISKGVRSIAVIGPNAMRPRTQGGGSAQVFPDFVISPLEGIRNAVSRTVQVSHAAGVPTRGLAPFSADQVTDPDNGEPGLRLRFLDAAGREIGRDHRLSGRLVLLDDERRHQAGEIELSAQYRAAEQGLYRIGVSGVGEFRMLIDGIERFDDWLSPEYGGLTTHFAELEEKSVALNLTAGQEVNVVISHRLQKSAPEELLLTFGVEAPSSQDEEEIAKAVDIAAAADLAIVVIGTNESQESEGFDRVSLTLPGRQDDLVRAVASVNRQTVVVVNAGSPVAMPWLEKVPSVLVSWFPGQEFGDALADVVFGKTEPGGRLPTTWPAKEDDVPILSVRPDGGDLKYAEGIHVGYRAWARAAKQPAFPFGHGLGYTAWKFGDAVAPATVRPDENVKIQVGLSNVGSRAGKQVVQAYLSRPDSKVDRPVIWLAGFATIDLPAGESRSIGVVISSRAFQHWNRDQHQWETEAGAYQVSIGTSATELPIHKTVVVSEPADFTEAPHTG